MELCSRIKSSIMPLHAIAHAQTYFGSLAARRSLTKFFCQSLKCTTLMLNFTVYNRSNSRTLVPWRIHGVNPPDISFRGFYHNEATRFIEGGSAASRLELQSTFVGASKERMDLVDSSLKAMDVISVFGLYAKFIVEEIGGKC